MCGSFISITYYRFTLKYACPKGKEVHRKEKNLELKRLFIKFIFKYEHLQQTELQVNMSVSALTTSEEKLLISRCCLGSDQLGSVCAYGRDGWRYSQAAYALRHCDECACGCK